MASPRRPDALYFYAIRLTPPDQAPRILVGGTDQVARLLACVRRMAPTADVLGTWPCSPYWLAAAVAAATYGDCVRSEELGDAVYQCSDLSSVLARCDAFFSLHPKHDAENDAAALDTAIA